MRVLSYVHTYNDVDVVNRTLDGIRRQKRRPDAMLLVDNGSTDETVNNALADDLTVIRNGANLGTSGAIGVGFTYALEHGFDMMWIIDGDSVPDPDALATLLDEFSSWPAAQQEETGFIACLPLDQPENQPRHGRVFTRYGRVVVAPAPEQRCYQCHVTIWSGTLYRMAAVKRIGLPNPDYFLDRGELEYAYRLMRAGFKAFIHQDAVFRQNIRAEPMHQRFRTGRVSLGFFEIAPVRCYMLCRNSLYFTLYDLADGPMMKFRELFRVYSWRRGPLSGIAWQTALFTLNFALRPRGHQAHIRACCRGIWHGLTGNIAARY
jgi:glycosyltransferase involved in cell wall biosynthesis